MPSVPQLQLAGRQDLVQVRLCKAVQAEQCRGCKHVMFVQPDFGCTVRFFVAYDVSLRQRYIP
jgi:hypothetical protein